jgi:hypothetical protein
LAMSERVHKRSSSKKAGDRIMDAVNFWIAPVVVAVYLVLSWQKHGAAAERRKHNANYPECPYSRPPLWMAS